MVLQQGGIICQRSSAGMMNNVSRTICLLKNLEIADNKTVELCVIELLSSVVQLKVSRVLVPGVGSDSALLMDNNLFFFLP